MTEGEFRTIPDYVKQENREKILELAQAGEKEVSDVECSEYLIRHWNAFQAIRKGASSFTCRGMKVGESASGRKRQPIFCRMPVKIPTRQIEHLDCPMTREISVTRESS